MSVYMWRLCFILAAVFLLAGGPQHPNGTMVEMLAHPAWVRSHALMLVGFVVLLIGLIALPRSLPLPARTRRWTRYAVIGTALQAVEMAFHTAAVVDHANLAAGYPTPVLTTHLAMTLLLYPIFAVTFAGFVIAAARDRVVGSRWIAWMGVAGGAAHGAAAILAVGLGVAGAEILFPLLMLCAVWLAFAGLWPVRVKALGPAGTAQGSFPG
jgi:hypothetical protein